MNKVYNQLEEQVVNAHNKVVDATGVGDNEVYRKAADTLVMTKARAVSLITSAATSIDASTNGAIPSFVAKGTEKVDDAFDAAKTKYNNAWDKINDMKFQRTKNMDCKLVTYLFILKLFRRCIYSF